MGSGHRPTGRVPFTGHTDKVFAVAATQLDGQPGGVGPMTIAMLLVNTLRPACAVGAPAQVEAGASP